MTETITGTIDLDGVDLDVDRVYLIDQNDHVILDDTTLDDNNEYSFDDVDSDANVMVVPWGYVDDNQKFYVDRPVANATGVEFSALPDSVTHHYDATELNLSDGDEVDNWIDLIGSVHMDNVDTGSPTFVESGISGLPSVEFKQDILTHSGSVDLESPFSVAFVAELTGTRGDDDLNLFTDGSRDDIDWRINDGIDNEQEGSFSGDVQDTPVGDAVQKYVLVASDDGTGKWIINGESFETGGGASQNSLYIGGESGRSDRSWQGYIAEVIIYDEKLDSNTRQSEHDRLADKWDITF